MEHRKYKNSKGQIMLNIILITLLIIVLLIGGYFIYSNIPGKPQVRDIIFSSNQLETGNLSYEVRQFYPNMKFNHNSISYLINEDCNEEKRKNMIDSFNELQNKIEIISFIPALNNPDIEVSCSQNAKHSINKDYFIAGEGGAKEIIQTGRYNVITQGIILLYSERKRAKCSWPNVELHELLHVFGFDHSSDSESLMYPYLESCDQKLDESIIKNMKELYSRENLPDLYFESVTGVKKGRYFDFNVTIKNSGTVSAESVILSIFDDEDKINDFELKNIDFGAGITYSVTNLNLNSRGSDYVRIIIDSADLIREIDEDNNIAELRFE